MGSTCLSAGHGEITVSEQGDSCDWWAIFEVSWKTSVQVRNVSKAFLWNSEEKKELHLQN